MSYGILKDEFYLDHFFNSEEIARLDTRNAIKIYNEKRLHVSLVIKHLKWYLNIKCD